MPYDLLYGRPLRSVLSDRPPAPTEAADFLTTREKLRKEASDAIALAQSRMKLYYDGDRSPPCFGDYVYLRLAPLNKPGYHIQGFTKLSTTRLGPLRVIRPVGPLAYEIELPAWMAKTHPVIFD
jgi:hypothetical protein